MQTVSYTKARNNFASLMDKVCEDHAPVIISRQNENPVVMLSLEDYLAMEETVYIMKSPKNAERLKSALQDFGKGINFKAADL